VILFGAVLGFIPHNFPKAKIFLGDGGSNFLGFVFASLAIVGSQSSTNEIPFFIPFMLSSLFLFDAGFTLLKNLSKGKNWLEPHLDHYYQRLIRGGYSHTWVTLFYSSLNIVLGILACLFMISGDLISIFLLLCSIFPFLFIVFFTIKTEKS